MSDAVHLQGTEDESNSSKLKTIASRFGIHIFLVALIVMSGIISPAFLSANNISNMLLQAAPLGIVVIGQAFVIILRGLDLSVASVMATAAMIATAFSAGLTAGKRQPMP